MCGRTHKAGTSAVDGQSAPAGRGAHECSAGSVWPLATSRGGGAPLLLGALHRFLQTCSCATVPLEDPVVLRLVLVTSWRCTLSPHSLPRAAFLLPSVGCHLLCLGWACLSCCPRPSSPWGLAGLAVLAPVSRTLAPSRSTQGRRFSACFSSSPGAGSVLETLRPRPPPTCGVSPLGAMSASSSSPKADVCPAVECDFVPLARALGPVWDIPLHDC